MASAQKSIERTRLFLFAVAFLTAFVAGCKFHG